MQERPMRFVLVCQCIAMAGLLVLIPRIGVTYKQIASTVRHSLLGHRELFWDRQTPGAAEDVIPPRPLEIIQIARAQRITNLRLSAKLDHDETTQQRVGEGALPIRVRLKSKNLFVQKGEPIPDECKLRHSGREVDFAVCN